MQRYKQFWPFSILIILSVVLLWPLFVSGYFSHHDFLHVMRIYEMRRCFADGQIPCRWVPDMGYGNGFPLFNYYGPLPYYLGALVSFGGSFVLAAKFLFGLPLFLGGLTMYLLLNRLYGKWPALAGAVVFSYAPYRAVDSYVRGAIDESFAIALFPLVLWSFLRLVETKSRRDLFISSILLGLLAICHNIMMMFFTPVLLGWITLLVIQKNRSAGKLVVQAFLLGIGLAAFFLLPAFTEKSLVHTETLTRMDLDFRAHFVTVGQLFGRHWGYGASVPGPDDTLSFQLGWPLWILVVLAFMGVCYQFIAKKQSMGKLLVPAYWLVVFLGALFMMHNQSAFVWEHISLLSFAQFPWRFLSVAIISGGILTGYCIQLIRLNNGKMFMAVIVIVGAVILNGGYFRPDQFFYQMKDQELLTGQLWEDQQKASIFDYLPKDSIEPREKAPTKAIIKSGNGEVTVFDSHSNYWQFQAQAFVPLMVEVPVYDFPRWQVLVDGQPTAHEHQNLLGRVEFFVPPGDHQIKGVFLNTPVRTVGNVISLVSMVWLGGLAGYAVFRKVS